MVRDQGRKKGRTWVFFFQAFPLHSSALKPPLFLPSRRLKVHRRGGRGQDFLSLFWLLWWIRFCLSGLFVVVSLAATDPFSRSPVVVFAASDWGLTDSSASSQETFRFSHGGLCPSTISPLTLASCLKRLVVKQPP